MEVICICWNCGEEIHEGEAHELNGEIWCAKCAEEDNGLE